MLSPEQSQRLANLSTALLADARVRLKLPESHLDPGIRPVVSFTAMVGTAVTAELETVEDEAAADLTPLLDATRPRAIQAPSSSFRSPGSCTAMASSEKGPPPWREDTASPGP